jgi:hypothetical protein
MHKVTDYLATVSDGETLGALVDRWGREAFLEKIQQPYDDYETIFVCIKRDETPKETAKREEAEAERKRRDEDFDLRQFKRLKAKYGA